MPLRPGSSRDIIQNNIREMIAAGHAPKQAIAASLDNARRHAQGGLVNRRFAAGGLWGEDNNLFASTPGAAPASAAQTAPVINYSPSIYGAPGSQSQGPPQQWGSPNPSLARGGQVRRFAEGGLFGTGSTDYRPQLSQQSASAAGQSGLFGPTATTTPTTSPTSTPTTTPAPTAAPLNYQQQVGAYNQQVGTQTPWGVIPATVAQQNYQTQTGGYQPDGSLYNWQPNYGYTNGNPNYFTGMSSGNVTNTPITIPTLADLQANNPVLTSPLLQQGLQPLQGQSLYPGQTPHAINPYMPTATVGGSWGNNPLLSTQGPAGSGIGVIGPKFVDDAAYQALKNIPPGTTGYNLLQYLPANLQPKGTPGQIKDLAQLTSQLSIALKQNPGDPFVKQQMALANQAYQTAMYGPMWSAIHSNTQASDLLRKLAPMSSLARPPKPMSKWDYAGQYGYTGQNVGSNGGRTIPTAGGFENALQTLKSAGWNPSKGYGPQADWGTLSNGQPRSAAQQQQLNSMLYAVSPATSKQYTAGGYPVTKTGSGAWSADPAWQRAHFGDKSAPSTHSSSPSTPSPAQILRAMDKSLGPEGKAAPESLLKYMPSAYKAPATGTTATDARARGGPVGGLGQTRRGPPDEPSDPAIFMPVIR